MSIFFGYLVLVCVICRTNQAANNPRILFKKLSPIQVNENLEIGHKIIDLKEKIIDLNEISYENVQISFDFLEDQDFGANFFNLVSLKEYFILDEYSGIIRTSKSIDLEHFCYHNLCQNKNINNEIYLNKTLQEGCSLNFKIKANKIIDNRLNMVFHISFDLIIHDINEFHPIFSQKSPLILSVNEEFSPIELLIGRVANDNDCSDKSQIYYKIKIVEVNNTKNANQPLTDNSNFDFQVVTKQDILFLYSNKALDRELYQTVTLDLIAYDRININEANTALLRIIINVIDINDNPPVFKIPVYNLEFDEGLPPGTELIRVEATDLDQGQNGMVSFQFASLSEQIRKNFFLNRTSGVLYLKNKLTSDIKNWTLQIKAFDNGSNQKSNFCLINIQVKDINNHKPEIRVNFFVIPGLIEPKFETIYNFDQNSFAKEDLVFLPKSIQGNTTIGIVSVHDPDSGLNGQVDECTIFTQPEQMDPIFLQNLNEIDPKSEIFSSNVDLNEAIKILIEAELSSSNKIFKEIKFLIRTKFNFDGYKNFNIYLKASDRGLLNKQTGIKSFKMIVLNANILNSHFLDEDELDENFVFNEDELNEYDEEMSVFSRLGLRVDLNENNLFPISLVKLTSENFGLNMPLNYEIFLPNNLNSKHNSANFFKKSSIFQCSVSLFKYLSIDQNGIIRLNRSLDREICQIFKFFIKAESKNDKRISSVIAFKINVGDLNDNPPRFEKKHFRFEFIKGINRSISIPIKDPDLNPKYIFRIESIDHSEKITDFFKLEPNENFKSISLLLNENENFFQKNKYLFNLIVVETSKFNTGMVNSDIALIEINILNEEELRPKVSALSVMGDLSDKDYSSIKILNDKIFYVNTNYDHLIDKLRIKESSASKTYLNLLKIQVKEKDAQNYRKIDEINYFIRNVKCYDSVENLKNKTEFSFPSRIDRTELFVLTETNGILNADLNSFKNLNSLLTMPFVCFIHVKIQNKTNQLCTNFTIILSTSREESMSTEVLELDAYLKNLYSIESNGDNLLEKIEKNFIKKKFKTISHVLVNSNLPLFILTVIIIFLLIILIVLFIISIIYLLTFCKFFDCDKNALKNDLKVNDCQNSLICKSIENEQKTHGWLRFKISKMLQKENRSKLSCPNICLTSLETEKNSKFIQKNDQKDYLLDSPILMRKIYENFDHETKDKYLQKYHLEYLFDNQAVKSQIEKKIEKKPKKISFKCNQGAEMLDNKFQDDSSSLEDDDFIIPHNNPSYIQKRVKNESDRETINNTFYNQFVLNNSRASTNPDDIVWIKNSNANTFFNFDPIYQNKEIVL